MRRCFVGSCLSALLIVSCASTGIPTDPSQGFDPEIHGTLYVHRRTGFSIYVPAGWRIEDKGQKYRTVMGPSDGKNFPHMGFADEEYYGNLDDYVREMLGNLALLYGDFRLVADDDFTTDTGLVGRRVTVLGRLRGTSARLRFYLIRNREETALLLITGTAPLDSGGSFDGLFDASVRTLYWAR